MKDFTIKTEAFEGPLDLLLSLIEKRKLFINDISLSTVTEEYIEYVNNLPDYSIADQADFIVIASTLILVKSKSLLPTLSITEEEEGSIHDLEDRLKQYQRIKELSLIIKEMYGNKIMYAKPETKWHESIFRASPYINQQTLHEHLQGVLNSLPTLQKLPQIVVMKIKSLEEAMDDLSNRIKSALKLSFKEMAGEVKTKEDKINVIVTFIAMLELVKRGVIEVSQHDLFDEINMETDAVNLPRYM
jgi:segregation and condensation protein A